MISSKLKFSYLLPILLLGGFFTSIIVAASLGDVSWNYKIGMWLFVAAIIGMVLFHIYSIPRFSIRDGSITKHVRGKIKNQLSLSSISSINYLVNENDLLTKGKRVHRIQSKDGSMIIPTQYYSNLNVLLDQIESGDELHKKQIPKTLFSPASLVYGIKIFRSFTACMVFMVFILFIYAAYRVLVSGAILELAIFPLVLSGFALAISFMGMFVVTGFTRIENDNIVTHMPFFLLKKVIPLSAVKVGKLEIVHTGKGGSTYTIALLLKNNRLKYSGVQLNSREEIDEVLRRLKGKI